MTVKKRRSVREQLERYPRIALHEAAFTKQPRRPLRAIAYARSPSSFLIQKAIEQGARFYLHTHPLRTRHSAGALPSGQDLAVFVKLVLKNGLLRHLKLSRGARRLAGIPTHVIATLDPDGRVKGYTVIRLRASLRKKARQGLSLKERRKIESVFDALEVRDNKLFSRLSEMGALFGKLEALGIQIRFFPMPGYFFSRARFAFIKKPRRG